MHTILVSDCKFIRANPAGAFLYCLLWTVSPGHRRLTKYLIQKSHSSAAVWAGKRFETPKRKKYACSQVGLRPHPLASVREVSNSTWYQSCRLLLKPYLNQAVRFFSHHLRTGNTPRHANVTHPSEIQAAHWRLLDTDARLVKLRTQRSCRASHAGTQLTPELFLSIMRHRIIHLWPNL